MGQVFRATDTRLKRQVAIKILPPSVAADADRIARFQREAEVLASLSHPHIAGIYGLEEAAADGSGLTRTTALVMELVEGEDLSARIARGPLALDEALSIAKQIAGALDAAHEQAIVHRDLKPANIKVRADGTVKVLDFGLAKALEPASPASPEAMHSPTITSPAMTLAGMILGTAAYMSPEQARGRPVDRRADIWAFGAVLFEMLTGQRAFGGDDVAETLANVITKEPAWDALPTTVPTRVSQVLRLCLRKDPRQRVGDVRDVCLALEGAFETTAAPTAPAMATSSRRRWPWIAAMAGVTALSAALAIPALQHLRETPTRLPPEMRLEMSTPATDAPLQFALSPDGRSIVFVASGDGLPRLWLRRLDEAEAQPLAGTEGAVSAFWSPDSRAIGFFARGALRRLDVTNGAPRVLASGGGAGLGQSGTWNADGTILYTSQLNGVLRRISADGGESTAVTRLDPPRQGGHRYPHFLPDGRHFLFYVDGTPEASGLYLGRLDGSTPTRLTEAHSGGTFLPPDRVVFVREGTLVAQRLDLERHTLLGAPVALAERVGVDAGALAGFAVSSTGLIAYRAVGSVTRQLTWFDRTGKALGVAGEPDASNPRTPELSPDGRRVALGRAAQGNTDVWLRDLSHGGMTRLTFDASSDGVPLWSPDGSRIAFTSNRTGALDIYVKNANGSAAEEQVLVSPNNKQLQSWSADGRWLVYYEQSPTTGRDLWVLDMTRRNEPPRVVANTPAQEILAQLSPDATWLAYQTNESGRFEIVVQSFPDPGGRWQISTAGGVAPRWRADGKELYFLAPDATMMAVPVSTAGSSFEHGPPVALFHARIVEGGIVSASRPEYAVSRDGRFLINQPVASGASAPITLVLNWQPPVGQ